MRSTLALAPLLAATLLSTGCASVFRSSRDGLKVVTDPPGATARAGDVSVVTPGLLKIPRRREPVTIRVEKDGFEPREVTLGWSRSGAIWDDAAWLAVGGAGTLLSGAICIDVWGGRGGCHSQTNTTPLLVGAAVSAVGVLVDLNSSKSWAMERHELVLRLEPVRLTEAQEGAPR